MGVNRKRTGGSPAQARPGVATDAWRAAILGAAGLVDVPNVSPDEVKAVAGWVAAMRDELESPTAADDALLGTLGRIALIELRLSRHVYSKGAVTARGEVRPALAELRQVQRLKAEVLRDVRALPRQDDSEVGGLESYTEWKATIASRKEEMD